MKPPSNQPEFKQFRLFNAQIAFRRRLYINRTKSVTLPVLIGPGAYPGAIYSFDGLSHKDPSQLNIHFLCRFSVIIHRTDFRWENRVFTIDPVAVNTDES